MGIQIGVAVKDVEHLIATMENVRYPCFQCEMCEDGLDDQCTDEHVAQEIKLQYNDVSIWMNVDNNFAWCDANHWGSNREKILYILNENNIEYVEG